MKYQDLRERIRTHSKYDTCTEIERAKLINPGFAGTFNLSFTEDPWLKKYGRFVDFDHDYTFSTIQSCVRPSDFEELKTANSWKYLGVFEIGDLTGIIDLTQKPNYEILQRMQVRDLINFFRSIGINPERIYPSYNSGGKVQTLSNGKYCFDLDIPKDDLSKKAFLEAGVPEENLIEDATRNTLLCLHVHRPTPWGYRNEINVNIGTKQKPRLLDIATIEYILWKPIFNGSESDSKNIVGLTENKNGVSICAIGIERLCMAINDLPTVQEVDYIKPVYDFAKKESVLTIESIRTLHRIYSDIAIYGCQPSRHQKEKLRKILKNIPKQLSKKEVKEMLLIMTENQPWHYNLREGIEPTLEYIYR